MISVLMTGRFLLLSVFGVSAVAGILLIMLLNMCRLMFLRSLLKRTLSVCLVLVSVVLLRMRCAILCVSVWRVMWVLGCLVRAVLSGLTVLCGSSANPCRHGGITWLLSPKKNRKKWQGSACPGLS